MIANFNLDQIADALEAGVVPEGLATAFRKIAEGEDALSALGLARYPGQRKLANVIKKDRRDQFVREAAVKFFPRLSKLQQAMKLAEGLSRYRNSGWRSDCNKTECPRRGRPEEFYWYVLKEIDRDLSYRTIYAML